VTTGCIRLQVAPSNPKLPFQPERRPQLKGSLRASSPSSPRAARRLSQRSDTQLNHRGLNCLSYQVSFTTHHISGHRRAAP
jgi:hypothetical protein